MTYYANYIVPFYYFDGECISVTSQNEGDRAKRLAQYHKLNVELLNVDNKNNVDHELRNLLSDVSAEVPRSYARVRGIPEGRRKRGSGNILCPSSSVERNKLLNDGGIIEYKLIRNRKIFESKWRYAPFQHGYYSLSMEDTPNCYIRVKANANNQIKLTEVYLYMEDFNRPTFRSAATLACLIRGAIAAFGVPGIIGKEDNQILKRNFEKWIDPRGAMLFGGYWDWRLMAATQLYDGPGWRWPKVRAELRRLQALKDNVQ